MKVYFNRVTIERGRDDFFLEQSWNGEVTRSRRPPEYRYDLGMIVTEHSGDELHDLHQGRVGMYELVDGEAFDSMRELAERTLTAEATIAEMGGTGPLNATSPVRMARFFYLAMRETAGTPVRKMMDAIEQALLTNQSDLGALEALTTTLREQREREAAEAAGIAGTTTSNAAGMREYMYSMMDLHRSALLRAPYESVASRVREALDAATGGTSGVVEVSAPASTPPPAPPEPPPREGTRFDLLEVDVEPRVTSGADGAAEDVVVTTAPEPQEDRD